MKHHSIEIAKIEQNKEVTYLFVAAYIITVKYLYDEQPSLRYFAKKLVLSQDKLEKYEIKVLNYLGYDLNKFHNIFHKLEAYFNDICISWKVGRNQEEIVNQLVYQFLARQFP